mmetsp:Transcript_22265/g.48645  ORF Transcript_22265/g.48645 Transcript_22265/m.48645 type:complete len:323 (+) Transcript_22265:208-1176(+)
MEQTPVTWPSVLRTSDLREKIKSAKVLCVGAGGIGCELLKTLVCTGFQNIEVIDLDTIETSNLNRQFLFRKHHVGQSKAQTAAEVVRSFKPAANILAHHANIKEARFNVDFFKGFDIVLNGLDNLEARRHVNRLCMAAQRPLIESGTAGYVGQVTVHLKGVTECFECQPKPVPKSFPICTLRNTPDRPIHCIVWSKDMLFNRLFGKPDEVTDLDEVSKESGEAQEGQSAENAAATAAAAAAAATTAFIPTVAALIPSLSFLRCSRLLLLLLLLLAAACTHVEAAPHRAAASCAHRPASWINVHATAGGSSLGLLATCPLRRS